jgi:hypothetical protein
MSETGRSCSTTVRSTVAALAERRHWLSGADRRRAACPFSDARRLRHHAVRLLAEAPDRSRFREVTWRSKATAAVPSPPGSPRRFAPRDEGFWPTGFRFYVTRPPMPNWTAGESSRSGCNRREAVRPVMASPGTHGRLAVAGWIETPSQTASTPSLQAHAHARPSGTGMSRPPRRIPRRRKVAPLVGLSISFRRSCTQPKRQILQSPLDQSLHVLYR